MWIIRGAPGAGKTAHILREFRTAVERGQTGLRIVVPTSTLVRHHQHELAREGVVFPPKWISSLSRFASQCAPTVQVIPSGLRRAIVRDVLRRGVAPEFNEVATTEGMASTVLDTIDLFENAGNTPASLKGKRLPPLGSAFLKVWLQVDEAIRSRGFSTRLDLFREAAKNVAASGLTNVWFDGFITFSRLEAELLRALDPACDLTIALPNGPEADEAYRMALALGAKTRQIAKDSQNEPARPKPRIEFFTPPTMDRETDEICRRILELESGGMDFRDMGVALRDNSTYLPALRAAFERFGIPARYYFAGKFADHPVAKFLSGLVECVLNGWDFQQALETFRMHPRWRGMSRFDAFDFALREAIPCRGSEALRSWIETHFEASAPGAAMHWLAERMLLCLRLDAWREEVLTPAQWAARLQSMTETLEDRRVDPPHDFTALEAVRSYGAALHVWSSALEEAVAFWPADQEPLPLEEFWKIAAECGKAASLRVADDRRNVVHVMSAFEARQWDVRALFICGMSDREFPRRHPENLLFPDNDAKKLVLGLRTARDTDEEEAKLFPSLLSRAREALILSVPAKDTAGRSVGPSGFLVELKHERKLQETAWLPAKPEPRFATESAGSQGRLMGDGLLEQLAGLHRTVSPTGLESLAQCNFQFFSRQALRLKARPDKPENRFSFLVKGNVLHDTLRKWTESGSSGNIVSLLEDSFDEACRKNNIPESYKLEVKRFELRRLVQALNLAQRWLAGESRVELELRLPLPNGVEMKGRADRIDVFGNDCVVVDYKSGTPANVQEGVNNETRLQGPLYALAAREALGLNPIAMVYWALQNDKLYGWGEIPGSGLDLMPIPEQWMESARERVIQMLDRYLTGEIGAKPTSEDQCVWCDYKQACRVEETHQLVAIGGIHA